MALCLWLPTFELRLELVRAPELDRTSVALLAPEDRGRPNIFQVSERAWAAGVRPGQTVAQAISLCPGLTLLEPDPIHYDEAQTQLLETLSSRTPIVEPGEERGKVFLGMDGMERLYGSPQTQIRTVLRALFDVLPAHLVAAMRTGFAPGTFGAWVAAVRSRPGQPVVVGRERSELAAFLAPCPVRALSVPDAVIHRLERLGLATLGDVARLDPSALVAQFGAVGREAREWASGQRVDPVRTLHRPRPIRVHLDLSDPTSRIQVLGAAVERLIERGLSRPERRGRSIHRLQLSAHLDGAGSWSADVVLRTPTAQPKSLSFALRSRLELDPPTRAVTALTLEFTQFGAPAHQSDLFGRVDASGRDQAGRDLSEGRVPDALREAVLELKLKLGHSPLYRVVEVDPWSRIPERRHALMNFDPGSS
jgi:nucleotidyltransferase/DNA polymerase involved in DNA repair